MTFGNKNEVIKKRSVYSHFPSEYYSLIIFLLFSISLYEIFMLNFELLIFLEKSSFYAFTNILIQIRQRRNSMNILDVSFFIISSIIRMRKSTVSNNFQQFYILGHPTPLNPFSHTVQYVAD